ncbi:MAG: hypothetical protein CSA22_09930 [Deltaproteobacteria bacterium]|nr:MAG: hypothetical protein CSA22_09930 [Deltaproteobacteria bacterium]
MKRCLFFLFFIFCSSMAMTALAHTPFLILMDNEDGTLTIEAGFSTGAGAEGVTCSVKTLKDGNIVLSQRFPASSSITIQIPKEPYQVIFDGGPGHKVVKKGPEPPGGFTVNSDAINLPAEPSDITGIPVPFPILITMIAIAIILVFLIPKMKRKKACKNKDTSS